MKMVKGRYVDRELVGEILNTLPDPAFVELVGIGYTHISDALRDLRGLCPYANFSLNSTIDELRLTGVNKDELRRTYGRLSNPGPRTKRLDLGKVGWNLKYEEKEPQVIIRLTLNDLIAKVKCEEPPYIHEIRSKLKGRSFPHVIYSGRLKIGGCEESGPEYVSELFQRFANF